MYIFQPSIERPKWKEGEVATILGRQDLEESTSNVVRTQDEDAKQRKHTPKWKEGEVATILGRQELEESTSNVVRTQDEDAKQRKHTPKWKEGEVATILGRQELEELTSNVVRTQDEDAKQRKHWATQKGTVVNILSNAVIDDAKQTVNLSQVTVEDSVSKTEVGSPISGKMIFVDNIPDKTEGRYYVFFYCQLISEGLTRD